MRIGRPARKHGVDDEDIWHAVRNMTHTVSHSDDLIMIIGPARGGRPLEIGGLGQPLMIPWSSTQCGYGRSSSGS